MLSKELLNMLVELVIIDYFIAKSLICLLLDFLILIGLVILMIEKAPPVGLFYVGANLVAWMSKKQNSVSLSTVEAEYIAAGSCCSQLLWMKNVLTDYGISQDTMVVYCDNSSAINISKNTVQHSKTKHIEIRYHFIRDLVERKIVCLEYIPTERQNADTFTKPLDRSKFETLRPVICVILCP